MQPVSSPAGTEGRPLGPASALDDYLAESRARGLSHRTCVEYERLIRRLLRRSQAPTSDDLHRFVFGPGPSGRAPSPSTAAVRRAAVASFCDFLLRRRYLDRNPAAELPRIRSRSATPRGLSAEEIGRLLDAIPCSPSGIRDRAIVLTALLTGLRRSELMALSTRDLEWADRPTIRVRVKGGQVRVRELPPPVLAAISTAVAADGASDHRRSGTLFRVSAAGFAANLRRYARQAGLPGVTPHVLRHTAAKLRRESGASLEEVSAFLGHASIATTAIYLRRLEGWEDRQWPEILKRLAIPFGEARPGMEARAGPRRKWPSERGNAHSADWQGGSGNGTTLPSAYSSSRLNQQPHPAAGGGSMTPPWRDERIGLLKSAVQKYIRRGEADAAYAAAARLLAMPNGRSALVRRLPVIAAEDVGITSIPASTFARDRIPADDEILDVVTGLSLITPKSKDAYWLAATVWDARYPAGDVSAARFRAALEDGDHRLALAIALDAHERRWWRSGPRLIDILQSAVANRSESAQTIAAAALQREAKGGAGTGELIAAAIIAAIEEDGVDALALPRRAARDQPELRLAWYAADGHTSVGQRALGRVSHRRGYSPALLGNLMFCYCSGLVAPPEVPSRWQELGRALDASANGWGTHEQGAGLWESLRDEIRAEIEHELRTVRL